MRIKKIAISLALLSSLSLSAQVSAHGMWITKVHGEQAVVYGHAGSTDSYDAKKVQIAHGFKTDGSTIEVEIEDHKSHVALHADDAAILSAVFDNGFYAQDKDGEWVNKRGDEVEGATSSNHYIKEGVTYLNARIKPVVTGLTLEIVPEVNPSSLQQGEELKVRVHYKGKPLADAEVKSNYFDKKAPKVKTDKDGYAVLKVAGGSFNILGVGHEIMSENPFDGIKLSSTLTFQAKRVKK